MRPRSPGRAETVGSPLRPAPLRAAIERVYEPGHHALLAEERAKNLDELRRAEDEAIRAAVRRQLDCGLDVVSDGEFRRYMFTNSFWDAVEGVTTDNPVVFTNARGERVVLTLHAVHERLRKVASPAAREASFLASLTDYPFKVTFPAASLFAHPFGVSPEAYPSADAFLEHALSLERELIADAVAAGCRYVQLDFPLYPYLCDERWRGRFEQAGHGVAELLDRALAADRAVLEGLPPEVTTALHLCRGNYRSSWLLAGSLEPVAERLFGLPYDVFLVEWDDPGRDGGFEPLRFVPPGKIVVLGIVSSKSAALEPEEELLRRLDEAAAFLPLDQLAISPQCGFASVVEGNELDEESQWRKLELVGRVADRLWG